MFCDLPLDWSRYALHAPMNPTPQPFEKVKITLEETAIYSTIQVPVSWSFRPAVGLLDPDLYKEMRPNHV